MSATPLLSTMLRTALYAALLAQTVGAFLFCCFLLPGMLDRIVTEQSTFQAPAMPLLPLALLCCSGCWLLARLHSAAIMTNRAARIAAMLNLAVTLWPNASMAVAGAWPLGTHGVYAFFALANACVLLAVLFPKVHCFLFPAKG